MIHVWHTDPLRCPKCGGIMRVIAIIDNDDPEVTEKTGQAGNRQKSPKSPA
jgi:hypothetical protein